MCPCIADVDIYIWLEELNGSGGNFSRIEDADLGFSHLMIGGFRASKFLPSSAGVGGDRDTRVDLFGVACEAGLSHSFGCGDEVGCMRQRGLVVAPFLCRFGYQHITIPSSKCPCPFFKRISLAPPIFMNPDLQRLGSQLN